MKKPFDAIVVLSVTPPTLSRIRKRVELAARLYRQGAADTIIFTGKTWGGLKKLPRASEAVAMRRYAERLGLPRRALQTEKHSLDTAGSLYFTKKLFLKPRGFRNIIIITHTEHMPKVKFLAKKILGPSYGISYRTSESNAHLPGHMPLARIKPFFKDIKDGNDRALAILMRNHAYYARTRYPELHEEHHT